MKRRIVHLQEYLAWALAWISTAFAPKHLREKYQRRITEAWLQTFRPPSPLRPAPRYYLTDDGGEGSP